MEADVGYTRNSKWNIQRQYKRDGKILAQLTHISPPRSFLPIRQFSRAWGDLEGFAAFHDEVHSALYWRGVQCYSTRRSS